MNQRTFAKTAASSTALLLLLAACGPDGTDTVAAGNGPGDGGPATTQTPTTVKVPAKIHIASVSGTAGGARAESAAADSSAPAPANDGKMIAPGLMPIRQVTYTAGPGLTAPATPQTSWFFPKDGFHVSDAQKAALAAAFQVSGSWAPLPADWGGGEALGPNDGTAANITISTDAMASWWYNPGPGAYPASEPCTTEKDASGQDVTTCPTPVPPVNVPDKAAAEAKARELITAVGLDPANFSFDTYADEWSAWVTGYLLLDGQRTPVSMYVGFGGDGVITGAGGFLARPVQGDQYDLVGLDKGVDRLNSQQYGWIGMGGAMAKSATADVAVGSGTAGSSGTAGTGVAVSTEEAPPPPDAPAGSDPAGDVVSPPIDGQMVCRGLTDDAVTVDTGTGTDAGGTDAVTDEAPPVAVDPVVDPNACPPIDVTPITITLTSVKNDLTMVWDDEGTIWLLPAYTFGDADGGIYTVIAIDDSFIQLPAPEAPVPETIDPAATDTGSTDTGSDGGTETAIMVDQSSADSLIGLSEDEATKAAESNGWTARVVERDGESLPVTMDYRTDRVDFTVEGGLVTAVSIG